MAKNLQFSPFTGNVFEGRSYADQGKALPEIKAVAAMEPGKKGLSPDMSAWLTGADADEVPGAGARVVAPYAQSTWVYVAVRVLAENIAQIPFRISRIKGGASRAKRVREFMGSSAPEHRQFCRRALNEDIITDGDVVNLFNNPHPSMHRNLFWEMIVTWNCLRGEFFILPLDNDDLPVDMASRSPRIKRMVTVPPELFWHVVMGYTLEAWRYTGSPLLTPIPSEMLLPTEVIHSRTPNPYLYWRGMSPLLLAMLPANADFAAGQFMKGMLMNNADTGLIATTDQNLTQEQRLQFMAALRERKRKAGTPDRPLFLSSGIKIEKPTISNVDMQFLQSRGYLRQEIAAIFGVPDAMIGFTEQRGRGSSGGATTMSAEKLTFIENTVTSRCRSLEAAVEPIVKTFGQDLIGWFDIDGLPIMQEARRDRVTSAQALWGMGVPFNEINEVYDLGFTRLPWGDTGYIPFNAQAVGSLQPGAKLPDPDENDPAENDQKSNPILRMQTLLKALTAPAAPHVCAAPQGFEESIAGSVRVKRSKLERFFFEQRGRVLAKLADAAKSVTRGVDDLFDKLDEDKRLQAVLDPLLRGDLQFGGDQIYEEVAIGTAWDMPPMVAMEYLATRNKVIAGINQTTWEELRSSLVQGLADGDTTQQLADRVKAVYTVAGDSRAKAIAITETNAAVNTGRMKGMKSAGIKRKGWITAHLERTRLTHLANEEISANQNGIPIDSVWPNGCSYPGDPNGAPGETINCRCAGYALPEGKSAPPVKFLSFETWSTKQK